MFNLDTWQEIWIILKQNRLRTILTGFAIAWGIFMLFILSSFGIGFRDKIMDSFKDDDVNVMNIYGGMTSLPYKGHGTDRYISFTDEDWRILENDPQVDQLCKEASPYNSCQITYKDQASLTNISGVYPIYQSINQLKILSGRFLNNRDINSGDKVVIISKSLLANLFKNGEDPIGNYVNIMSTPFKVIGVFEDQGRQQNGIVITSYPIVKTMFHITRYQKLSFTTKGIRTIAQNNNYKNQIFNRLAKFHEFSPDDKGTLWISSTIQNMKQARIATSAIQIFIWIIGISMLISGITGVGNIMLVTVKERTNEIGIRKALGAKPSTILQSIVLESLTITVFFGIIGIIMGGLVIGIINFVFSRMQNSMTAEMLHPIINMGTTIGAFIVLVIAGIIAGYIPARKAVKIKPIEAIQYR